MIFPFDRTDRNALEAGVNGAAQTIKLVANIAANLIALLAFIKCLNSIVSWFASLINLGHIDFTVKYYSKYFDHKSLDLRSTQNLNVAWL